MPRRATAEYRTALGAFMEQWRRSRNWTQIELQNALGLPVLGDRYVSKVESGQIRQPRKDFLEALAALTGAAVEELSQKASEAAPAPGVPSSMRPMATPRVLFGHCLWGVPVFLAAESGLLTGFRVASFQPKDFNAEDDPAWIKPRISSADLSSADSMNPRRGALSAANVFTALRRREAEIGVVPGDFARRYPDVLLRVGVVFDGPGGMILLSPRAKLEEVLGAERVGRIEHQIPVRTIGEVLSPLSIPFPSKESQCATLGYDEPTVAREVLEDIKRTMADDALERCRWHVSTAELATANWTTLTSRLEEELPEHYLFGIITWDPLATWIVNKSDSVLIHPHIVALRGSSTGPSSWYRHRTFEIVIHKDHANDRMLISHLERLISQLGQVTAGPLASQDTGLDADTLDAIASYFDLGDRSGKKSKAEIRKTVEQQLLAYRYVTYWYEGTRSMLSARRGPV